LDGRSHAYGLHPKRCHSAEVQCRVDSRQDARSSLTIRASEAAQEEEEGEEEEGEEEEGEEEEGEEEEEEKE
uniref:Uncharacterized protein n=1 Tax=Heligmosomoides polygyrus TaxID=6339 RepID=A0A183G4G2_HELPZ